MTYYIGGANLENIQRAIKLLDEDVKKYENSSETDDLNVMRSRAMNAYYRAKRVRDLLSDTMEQREAIYGKESVYAQKMPLSGNNKSSAIKSGSFATIPFLSFWTIF